MEPYERNLMISLCLGLRLEGSESPDDLERLVENASHQGDLVSVQPAQKEMADWLSVSFDDCRNQQAASVLLWEHIEARGYSLVDVPMKIRRPGFGGSTEIQKRHARASRSRVSGRIVVAVIMAAAGVVAWLTWRQLR